MTPNAYIFEGPKVPYRGFTCRAKDKDDGSGNAIVEVLFEKNVVRSFEWPTYKVWNILAHFNEIVDSEIAKNADGYRLAAWTGFPNVVIEPAPPADGAPS